MLFNSFRFVLFLLAVLAIYYSLPHRQQNRFLLAASLFFYACWDWRFLAPLLFTTTLDYWCAMRMSVEPSQSERKRYLLLSVTANIGLLGFFKYLNFLTGSSLGIILPVGISFYTFQALSYTIDVYRGEMHSAASYADFLLAVLYFPHLVAGPIQRANSLLPQVTRPRHPRAPAIAEGIHLIVWGYFKKVYIADNLAPLVNRVFAEQHPGGLRVLLACYAFAFQIFCDFSGYTDIARGIAKLMGFEFMLNFNWPYLAAGPREFWTRWHISLSTWLRDYLYFPLGGNRRGKGRIYVNLMITMVLGGLWHGAAWTFLLWGFYHGLLLVVSRAIGPRVSLLVPRWLRVLVFFHVTCYGWLIFRATSLAQVGQMTAALLHPFHALSLQMAVPLIQLASVSLLMFLFWRIRRPELRAVCYAALLYLILFRGGQPRSFIYFQF